MQMVRRRKAANPPPLVHGALGLEVQDDEAVSAVFPLRHESWAGGNNLQRPSEEEAGVANRNEGMGEEKGGPGIGLRSYIYRKAIRGRYTAG